jgi:uncharacterized protein YfbU (UPF0304 family)
MKNNYNSDPVNAIVLGGLDQTLPQRQTEKDWYKRIDEIIETSISENNPEIAFHAMENLQAISRFSGKALAKFIYTFHHQWEKFNQRDSFEDRLVDRLGIQPVTIKRYYTVWKFIVEGEVPKEYMDKIKLHPIKCLIPIATMYDQGYEVESNQWLALANAPDPSSIRKIIRKIKEKEPKKGSLQLEINWKSGEISAWKDGQRYYVGYLETQSKDEPVQQAIKRIMSDKILEK